MIRVVRISGESFDLETQKSVPKALVLSNGIRELSIYVEDEAAVAVIALMREAEVLGAPKQKNPKETELVEKAIDPEMEPETGFELAPIPPEEFPVVDDSYAEGKEPGEEYDDPLTGAGSI